MTEKKNFKVVCSSECTHSERSDEQYGSWSADYSFKVHSFCVDSPSNPDFDWPWETDTDASSELIPDEMYCVWVKYSDGDTFGRSTGNGQIVGLFNDEGNAHNLAKSISENNYKPSGSHYTN